MTKRSILLDRGYPASALLLAVLWTPSLERHAVLIVKSNQGDLVLDNLKDQVVRWDTLPYQWMKISTPEDPQFWRAVRCRKLYRARARAQNAAGNIPTLPIPTIQDRRVPTVSRILTNASRTTATYRSRRQ